jgi:hypothetical protein
MIRYAREVGLVLIIALLVAPAAAFTMNRIDIQVAGNGDAEVTADYPFTWVERIVVFIRIAEPQQELENAISQYSGKDVTVTSVSPGETILSVSDFATVSETGEAVNYTTPFLDFSGAEQAIGGSWVSRFVTVDASPDISVVSFPDGYEESFPDSLVIPSLSHEVKI